MSRSSGRSSPLTPYLQVAPLALIMLAMVGIPLITVLLLSFWQTDGITIYPEFTWDNYAQVLTSPVTLTLFLNTLKYAALTLIATMLIGFTCSYFLVFHVRNLKWQIGLFLLCTIPFWTSNVIRMVSWIPFLGREGVFNQALISAGVIDQPLDILLYSDFAVVLTYIHLFTLFMIVPIFNSMAKINPNLIEAARDAGASGWQILWTVIVPLSRTGIALGSIFVVTLVMGDFFVVRVMSGGQSASVVSAMKNQIDQLFYPEAAAMAVLLIVVVLLMVSAILRIVDIRSELAK
ncbi:ABC transporter permease [Pseudomonas sp. GX19020]|uniref:ABC transporter permease n=1 Tax=Pseudomonadota TaxID=1224 RepID=UPI00089AD019|nr:MULTISPECIES: ABC transporter permease [Pseudomonadota]MCL4067807.1 ABC transporter permease [Pseudomonas sp. GX19020]SEC43513.1 putative spermidine/putrescine transport system permease protein [Rhodobacter sp. 24-YEA-8]